MKKLMIGTAALALVAGSFSCGNGKTTLKSEKDSVAYALGFMQGGQYAQNLRMSAEQGQKLDSAEFLRGFKEGLSDSTKVAYAIGIMQAQQIAKLIKEDTLSTETFLAAFRATLFSDSTNYQITDSLAQVVLQKYGERKQAEYAKKQEAEMEKKYGANKKKGTDFIEKFKKEEGVQVTASGIAYKVEKPGTGATPTTNDKVVAKYKGTLIDGKVFDDSKGEGREFSVTGVIPGWTEILQLMKEGEKIKVVIPQELAYGERGGGSDIEPFSTLVFEIELVKVIKGDAKADATQAGHSANDGHNH